MDGEILVINQCTAWCEQEGFRHFLLAKFPSIKVYYCEEEPGCEVYYTNDMTGDYFPEKYLLDSDDQHEYHEAEDKFCCFHEFKYVEE